MVRSLHICGIRLECLNGRIVVLYLEIKTIYLIRGNPKAQLPPHTDQFSIFVETTISFQTYTFWCSPRLGEPGASTCYLDHQKLMTAWRSGQGPYTEGLSLNVQSLLPLCILEGATGPRGVYTPSQAGVFQSRWETAHSLIKKCRPSSLLLFPKYKCGVGIQMASSRSMAG